MSVSSSCLPVYIDDEHIYFVSLRKSELLLPCFISQLTTFGARLWQALELGSLLVKGL